MTVHLSGDTAVMLYSHTMPWQADRAAMSHEETDVHPTRSVDHSSKILLAAADAQSMS